MGLAALGQTNSISTTLHSTAGDLAYTTDSISRALQSLAEETNNVRHFY